MRRKKEYRELDDLFNSGNDFTLTDSQFLERVGEKLSKNPSYIKNRSALSRVAKEHGFTITITDTPIIQRTLTFKKHN